MKYLTQKNLLYSFGVLFIITALLLLNEQELWSKIFGYLLATNAIIFILTIIWERKDRPKKESIAWTVTGLGIWVTAIFGVLGLTIIMWIFASITICAGAYLFYLLAKGR